MEASEPQILVQHNHLCVRFGGMNIVARADEFHVGDIIIISDAKNHQ
ncbi:hypothetical protein SAMN05443248_5981 [Bradyrhizobium erythrophlei]|uniref:Uncharacterized protein n=1 Tax=Bradyrhizobium erythrophlei TaxID=1437360 RepID=A0A1M5VHZ9_9BRAD|nr:hypothetical protein SAMN05443248_5981 [Bradyrhizobium erythrophlei]